MAHFAKLDENNVVLAVHVINNSILMDDAQNEVEANGVAFLSNLHGHSNWKQTSYSGNFRKNFAGMGYTYDVDLDAFVPPKPYPSWILNTDLAQWESPVAMPNDDVDYLWDEVSGSWQPISDGNSD